MTGFENGSISLDAERNTYYAGQVLSGKLEFALSQPLVFTAIKVEFHGDATVKWRQVEIMKYNDSIREETIVPYTAHEEYFNVVHCVCGGVGLSQLAAGSHSIPFRFQIPPSVPSYLDGNGRDGGVFYYVKACLLLPDGHGVTKLMEPFKVVVPVDLNVNPEMKRPIEFKFDQALNSCLCGGSGVLTVSVRLPASGYCPGQAIPIQVDADNQSSAEICRMIFELVQRETFQSQKPPSARSPSDARLAGARGGPVLARSARRLAAELRVPALLAPALDNCGIIAVEYFLKVKLVISGCNMDLEDESQIWLGTVPLRELTQGEYVHPMQELLPKGLIPNLNAPPEVIEPYVYPSSILETRTQPEHNQDVTNRGINTYSRKSPANAPFPGIHSPRGSSSAPPAALPPPAPPSPGAVCPDPSKLPPYTTSVRL